MRDKILTAAMRVAAVPGGFKRLTRERVAKEAGVAASLVTYYFGSVPSLRDVVVRKAIEDENLPVLGGAVADRHGIALRAEDKLKARALRSVYS
ncbi:MAG: TetR family transcriptional regulator [Steroidobacteraceae bacterium]